MSMPINPNYRSYLLRFWRAGGDQPWRASLQSTATGEKIAFVDLSALFAFLVEQAAVDEEAPTAPATPSSSQDSHDPPNDLLYRRGEAL
jgi:hypothetical protein